MAYTYNDVLSAAKTAGVMDRFTQSDLAAAQKNPEYGISLASLLKDIGSASTAEQQLLATEAANQLRKSYGTFNTGNTMTPGVYMSGNSGTDSAAQGDGAGGSFSYGNQSAYQELLDSIVNQDPFSYDASDDPAYSAYRKAYMREGDRASANALAQASAASGGRPSSYAMTAAQQAGNYYAGQLGDIIPTLEQQAYERYLGDLNSRLNGLNAMMNDRNFDYQQFMDEQAYEQQQFVNALALYEALGYATPEVAKILGIGSGSSGGTSYVGSSGGGGGGGYNNGSLSAAQIRELQNVLGVTADGKYGRNSQSAAGGLSAEEAYAKYVTGGGGDLYSDMLGELQGDSTGGGDIDYAVTNKNGDGWIQVGSGRMTWTELEKLVNQGKVVEVIDKDKGTITYKYKTSTGNGSGNSGNSSGSGHTGSGSSGGGNNQKNTANMLN